ncbi:MAG: LacI family DNA-binding transcriptional regulator [Anaerolineae bacterium]
MKRVSIKDIAKAASVSHSTVSRALGDSQLVSHDTKERIQRLAREMGYSPDAQARSLVMGRTQTVGVVVTTITDPFIAEIVQAIENTAQEHGYSVILASSNSEPEREIAAVEMLQSQRVDAVLVTSSRIGALYHEHLERLGVPIVLINSHHLQAGTYTYSVNFDNHHGAYLAAQHLVDLGHRRIAYVAAATDHSDNEERAAGYRQALGEAGIVFDPRLVVPGTGSAGGGERALPVLRALPDPPTAACCYNDMTAIGLIKAAQQAGLTVPDDLAVVGFDDIPLARYVCPTLTTIAQPMPDMGQFAMCMILDLVRSEGLEDEIVSDIVVQGQLVVRESSGAVSLPARLNESILEVST